MMKEAHSSKVEDLAVNSANFEVIIVSSPAPHSDFLFYIRDLHNQDLDMTQFLRSAADSNRTNSA
jgi:hypothetical protein